MAHVYEKDFKYTPAAQSRVEDDYLRKKFKRLIAEQKAQAEAAKQQPKGVLKLRRQA